MQGEFNFTTWYPSPNITTTNKRTIDTIIIHGTLGTYEDSISWLSSKQSQASCHFILKNSNGEIGQLVKAKDIAWHAGNMNYNRKSIGIEHEWLNFNSIISDTQYKASALLVSKLITLYNIPFDRQHIIEHCEVKNADGTKGGSDHHGDLNAWKLGAWNWDKYFKLINDQLNPITYPDLCEWAARTYTFEVFGYPISTELIGKINNINCKYQMYEKGRLEYHLNDNKVYIGNTGAELMSLTNNRGIL